MYISSKTPVVYKCMYMYMYMKNSDVFTMNMLSVVCHIELAGTLWLPATC